MTSAKRFYRLNLSLALLGMFGIGIGLIVAVTRVQLGTPDIAAIATACGRALPSFGPDSVLVGAVLFTGLVVTVRGGRSFSRRLRAQRRLLKSLSQGGTAIVDRRLVNIVESNHPQAFCAGWFRPNIYLSSAALTLLGEEELRAVVAHEGHHQDRRDPLRLMVAGVVADALFFFPALQRLSTRYAELAEIAADEAATLRADGRSLASALLTFGERSGHGVAAVGIAAERVDHLLGGPQRWDLPLSVVAGSLLVLGLLSGLIGALATLIQSGSIGLPGLLADACMAAMVLVPLALLVAVAIAVSRRRPGRTASL